MTRYRLLPETDMETNLEDCLPTQREPQESPSASECASTVNTKLDVLGLTLTEKTLEEQLARVVNEAWQHGFTVKSTVARAHAELVAMAASLQLISTRIAKDVYGNEWQVTVKGLRWLNEMKRDNAGQQ